MTMCMSCHWECNFLRGRILVWSGVRSTSACFRLVKSNHVTTLNLIKVPSDWYTSITWPYSTWPRSHLIGTYKSRDHIQLDQGAIMVGTHQSCDHIELDQGAIWLVHINHVTLSRGFSRKSKGRIYIKFFPKTRRR